MTFRSPALEAVKNLDSRRPRTYFTTQSEIVFKPSSRFPLVGLIARRVGWRGWLLGKNPRGSLERGRLGGRGGLRRAPAQAHPLLDVIGEDRPPGLQTRFRDPPEMKLAQPEFVLDPGVRKLGRGTSEPVNFPGRCGPHALMESLHLRRSLPELDRARPALRTTPLLMRALPAILRSGPIRAIGGVVGDAPQPFPRRTFQRLTLLQNPKRRRPKLCSDARPEQRLLRVTLPLPLGI